MQEKKYFHRLFLYLKSGTNLVIDFKADNPASLNPQIEALKKAFGKPVLNKQEDKDQSKVLESVFEWNESPLVIEFKGLRNIHVCVHEIAAFEVVLLVVTPTEKEKAPAE